MPYTRHYPCKIKDCKGSRLAKGYCSKHYQKFAKYGDPLAGPGSGLQTIHEECIIQDCSKKHTALGFCQSHYKSFIAFLDRHKEPIDWKKHSNSTDKRYIDVYVPSHPMAAKSGKVKQHRLVMEEMVGRYLERHENVHHKNGDRSDNRPENLELWSVKQPKGQRIEDKIQYAIEILKQYAPEKLA